MEVGDWITLAAVIVALGIGVASILHTQSLQKKERDIQRIIQRIQEIQEWILEICNIASSGSPPGDDQEQRNRKWQARKIVFSMEPIKVEAKKLDSKFPSEKKLEDIIGRLSEIVEEHMSNPETLGGGEQSGVRIADRIISNANEALSIISNIKDKLQL